VVTPYTIRTIRTIIFFIVKKLLTPVLNLNQKIMGTHEGERTVLYKMKTDDIVQTTHGIHTTLTLCNLFNVNVQILL